MKRLLIIDDEENMLHMLEALLSSSGFTITSTRNAEQGIELLSKEQFDYVLCDIKMPGMGGMEFLKAAELLLNNVPVIMMSAYGAIDTAVEAMKAGAYDFISKPFKKDEVLLTLRKAEERERLRKENVRLKEEIKKVRDEIGFGEMVWEDRAMDEVVMLARKVAAYDSTVLLTGASGTGKELMARGIHHASPRAEKHFFAINCGSIPAELIESELFGYVKGAFTGADKSRKGLFEEADGSTIFLDEIGELPLSMQVKLLRVLQENEVKQVGGTKVRKINVRVIAATSKNVESEVEKGLFREDLFYRLNVFHIQIPSLINRRGDIPLLCKYFIEKFNRKFNKSIAEIKGDAMDVLLTHVWPGNVRELENVIQRAVILSENDLVEKHDLALLDVKHEQDNLTLFGDNLSLKDAKKILEREFITRVLEKTKGNKSSAAKILELSYPALLSKIKEYGI